MIESLESVGGSKNFNDMQIFPRNIKGIISQIATVGRQVGGQ